MKHCQLCKADLPSTPTLNCNECGKKVNKSWWILVKINRANKIFCQKCYEKLRK